MKDSISYILNDEKVDATFSMPNSAINDPKAQLGRECQYVENDVKTAKGVYVGTRNLISSDIKDAVSEMMEVKKFYEKLDGRAALHGIISLSENESDIKNAPELMKLCEEVLAEVFPNHQAIFAVHTNTENLHIHFIVNSVGLDGKKIHQDDKFMRTVLHPCVNKYAKRHGFTVNEKWNGTEEEFSEFTNNKIHLRDVIDRAIEQSNDFEEFIEELKNDGLTVNVGVHISLKTDQMKKAIRTHQLGPNYTKDAIIERIFTRKEALHQQDLSSVPIWHGKGRDLYQPEYQTMKRYKSMDEKEKKYVLAQLKLGRNPWRIHNRMSWQLNDIANELNQRNRIHEYLNFYAKKSGTLEEAAEQILYAKKIISSDKKKIKEQIRQYKPILDIYKEMQKIEQKAYLYEHEKIDEFRPEYEKYRELTKRLKEGYNKNIYEVADFIKECEERFLYADGQLRELSEEYREIKKYAKEHGNNLSQKTSLSDQIGLFETKADAKRGLFEADSFFLVSRTSSVMLRVMKMPTVDEKGRTIEKVSLVLMSKHGEIIDQYDSTDGIPGGYDFLKGLEKEYGLIDPVRVKNASVAMEYLTSLNPEDKIDPKQMKRHYSFTQAINLQSVKDVDGIHIIMNSANPAYMAVLQSSEHMIVARIIDSNGNQCNEFVIPSLKDRSSSGFGTLSKMQREYGFSDEMISFENLDEARQYMEQGKQHQEKDPDRNYKQSYR